MHLRLLHQRFVSLPRLTRSLNLGPDPPDPRGSAIASLAYSGNRRSVSAISRLPPAITLLIIYLCLIAITTKSPNTYVAGK